MTWLTNCNIFGSNILSMNYIKIVIKGQNNSSNNADS